MARLTNWRRLGITAAAAAIIVLLGAFWAPTLWLRWNFHSMQQHFQTRQLQQARNLLIDVQKSTYAPLHFAYQNLMREADHVWEPIRQYKDWVEANPQDAALHALYSRIQVDPPRKQASLAKAVELDPQNECVLFVQIENILDSGKTIAAEKLLAGIQADHWLRWIMEGRVAARLGDNQRAKDAYEKALLDGAVPIAAAVEYARFCVLASDLSQGGVANPFAKWSADVLALNPTAYAYAAWLSPKPAPQSAADLPTEISFNPDSLAILCRPFLLESALLADPQPGTITSRKPLDDPTFKKVYELIDRASKIDPQNPEVLFDRGLLALSKKEVSDKDKKKALHFFTADSRADSSNSRVLFHSILGDDLAAVAKFDLAASHYRKAWGELPEMGAFLKNLARFYSTENNLQEALKILEKANAMLPKDIGVFSTIAESYMAMNELDKARATYGKIIAIDEQNRYARDRIAEIWMKKNNPARAAQIYQTLLSRDPENGYCHAQLARILLRDGRIEQADEYVRQVKTEHPQVRDMEEILRCINEVELAKKAPKLNQ